MAAVRDGLGTELTTRQVRPATMTVRQREVVELVTAYVTVAEEPPSYRWLARRLRISRQRAHQHVRSLRERGFLHP